MSNKIMLPAALLLVVIASCKPKYDETTPHSGPVTEAIFASGSIEPKNAYTITSLSDGFIQKSLVVENDVVKDGQLLFQLDNRQQRTQVAIAQNNLNFAQTNAATSSPALVQAKTQVATAALRMQNDSVTLSRFEKLYNTRSVSLQELDNARISYQAAVNTWKGAAESYKLAADRARQDLMNSQSMLQNARAGNQYYELVAIGPGKVYQVFKKQGDLVRRGEQVAKLGNPDSIVINLDIDEGSIAKVAVGQQVLVELNTEKNKTYEARISKIFPHFNEASQSYPVEARFLQEMTGLISGTQLQANIITSQKSSALLIPHNYLMENSRVLIKKGDAIDTATVVTGIVSDKWIEVTNGLKADDKIVKMK